MLITMLWLLLLLRLLVFIRRWGWLMACHLCSRSIHCSWHILILIIISNICCSLDTDLIFCYWSAAVLLDWRQPCFRNFISTISIDFFRMKSYVDGLFNRMSVPVWITTFTCSKSKLLAPTYPNLHSFRTCWQDRELETNEIGIHLLYTPWWTITTFL